LLTNYGHNAVNALDVDVVGVFESGIEAFDAVAVNIPMESTKTLLNVPDNSAHLVVVVLDDTARTAEVATAIDKLGMDRSWPLDVQTWDALSTVYHKIVRLFSAILRFIRIVVILIVLFSITNTVTMSVYERFREIGSIRAIGTTRAGVRWMFVMEGAFIGLMGGILGALVAHIPRLLLNNLNIILPPPPILTVGVPLLIKFVPSATIQAVAVATGLSIFASIFPARRAAKLSIVTALRSV
jgi:putative ABC transport system permease protein